MATNYSLVCFGGLAGKSVTASSTTDYITLTNHGLRGSQSSPIAFKSGTLPTVASGAALALDTAYYPKYISSSTFELYRESSRSTKIDFTSNGSSLVMYSAYWATLPAGSGTTGRARYGTPGSERVFDLLTAWYTDRKTTNPPATTDSEVCEISDFWTTFETSVLNLDLAVASTVITTVVDGARSEAWHDGVISTAGVPNGFILDYSGAGDTAVHFNGTQVTLDGFSIATSGASKFLTKYLQTSCVFATLANCILYGYGGTSGSVGVFDNNASLFTIYNNIIYGLAYGMYFDGYYAVGSLVANNLVCKCTNGMYMAATGTGNGSWYNNISIGNTTNWNTYSSTFWYGAGHNVGATGNTPWYKGSNTGVTMATTDFTDYNNYDFTHKSSGTHTSSDPTVDAGVTVIGMPSFDIKDFERPAYNNGAAEYWDCGPFEFNFNYPRPAVRNLNFSNLVAGSQVIVYETGTQTALSTVSSSGTTETYDYGSDVTVDYTVMQAGYIPVRETGIALTTTNTDRTITQVVDQNYVASSGLTWGTNATIDATNKYLKASVSTSGRNLYSFSIESFITQSSLANVAFDFQMNGPGGLVLKNGWETRGYTTAGNGYDWNTSTSTLYNITSDGVQYINSSNVVTATFASITTLNVPTGIQARFQQADGTGTTNFRSTGDVNQLIQVYGDSSHGSVNKLTWFVAKVQAEGYDQAATDVVAINGNMEGQGYIVPLAPLPNGIATGDPGISAPTVSVGTYTYAGYTFGVKIVVAGSTSGTQLLRYLRYNFQNGIALTGDTRAPFDWFDLVQTNGTSFKTVRGTVYGTAAVKGVIVYQSDGTTIHPDFNLFTADDGTTYTPPQAISINNANLVQHSTVLLRNVTKGTELDLQTNISAGGYSFSCLIGPSEVVSVGDTITIYATYGYGTSYKYNYTESAVATTSGIEFLGTQLAWTDANNLATDGSIQTEFTADYPNIQVDITSPDAFWQGAKLVAWFLYNQTTADGIRNYFGSITSNGAVWTFLTSIADIYIDVLTTTSLAQNDSVYVQRDDGIYPQVPVTTGGGGIGMKQTGEVFVVTVTGGNVITGDISDIPAYVPSASANAAATLAAAVTTPIHSEIKKVNGYTISGAGTVNDPWGP